jgi:hypothetical protein
MDPNPLSFPSGDSVELERQVEWQHWAGIYREGGKMAAPIVFGIQLLL